MQSPTFLLARNMKIVYVKLSICINTLWKRVIVTAAHLDEIHEVIVAVLQEIDTKVSQEESDVQG